MAAKRSPTLDHCPAPWLDDQRGYLVDWMTQVWVKMARRKAGPSDGWLMGPFGKPEGIGERFYQDLAGAENLKLTVNDPGSGLVHSMATLVGEGDLDPRIADFYEHTADYDFKVSSSWCSLFYPFGWLIAFVFSRRLQQLNVPLSRQGRALELTNEVVALSDPNTGDRVHTGWLRKRPHDDSVVYVGLYSHSRLKSGEPVLKIVFPLPNGNATVLMRGQVQPDKSLLLSADGKRFGEPGFYFLVRDARGGAHARHVRSVHEQIHVYVREGELQADHTFRLFRLTAFRLHYAMSKRILTRS